MGFNGVFNGFVVLQIVSLIVYYSCNKLIKQGVQITTVFYLVSKIFITFGKN